MVLKSRKFRVWFVSLGVVLAVYLLYGWLSKTPQIDIERETTAPVSDIAVDEPDSEIGMVGDVGVGTVRVARFTRLNPETRELEREFGFEKLLHKEGDEWEIEKPFMNIFRRDFKCYITADEGEVRVETTAGKPSPEDATLTGNVIIHILPQQGSNIRESFIYLDDIIFIGEESQFSSDGPIKFVSQDAQMLGRGLRLVYNDELDHLEFLRIIHLDSLQIKASDAALFSPKQAGTDALPETDGRAKVHLTDIPQESGTSPPTDLQKSEQKEGEYYRWVFIQNVVIDSPEQVVFADEVSINNLLFGSKASSEGSAETGTVDASSAQAPAQVAEQGSVIDEQAGTDVDSSDKVQEAKVSVVKQSGPEELNEQFVDVVVTCDNGIVIVPMDSPRPPEYFAKLYADMTTSGNKAHKEFDDTAERTRLIAQRVDYYVITGDTVAGGPLELLFYADDVMSAESTGTTVPVEVTAQKQAKFLPALDKVIFEGDALCKMLREDLGIQYRYTLSAPKLVVDLSKDESSPTDIEHLTASGGVVRLATIKTVAKEARFAKNSRNGNSEELLGGIELKCRRFDYDPAQQLCLATGPGVIKVDNSRVSKPRAKVGKFSLQRPCYAIVRDFETLSYFLETNQIVADAASHELFIDYIPIVKGKYGQQISATAGHIEANLVEIADSRTELSTLTATGGITYEEQGKKKAWGKSGDIQFGGSGLFYDAGRNMMTVWGDDVQSCYLNGALVDGIKYNLKTGRMKTAITGPSILQVE